MIAVTYTVENYRTKAALKRALAEGTEVRIYEPGLGEPVVNGTAYLEGPHYPAPHSWYAAVLVRDGLVVKVLT